MIQKFKKLLQKRLHKRNGVIVLMYHRVTQLPSDPWGLAVSPHHFEQQLSVLKKYHVIPARQLCDAETRKKIPSGSICITFDDGYRDNFTHAKPLLEKYGMPALFFISTGYTGTNKYFWWDELENIVLRAKELPQSFQYNFAGDLFTFYFKENTALTQTDAEAHKNWVYPQSPPTERSQLYFSIWEKMRGLPTTERDEALQFISEWAKNGGVGTEDSLSMNAAQLREIASNNLFSLGGHTVTHPALAFQNAEDQKKEISESMRFLIDNFPGTLNTMSFPYGNFNNDTLSVVEEQHLDLAFTTEEKPVDLQSRDKLSGRFQVGNWDAREFEIRLRHWLS